jgi:hypothetical protein
MNLCRLNPPCRRDGRSLVALGGTATSWVGDGALLNSMLRPDGRVPAVRFPRRGGSGGHVRYCKRSSARFPTLEICHHHALICDHSHVNTNHDERVSPCPPSTKPVESGAGPAAAADRTGRRREREGSAARTGPDQMRCGSPRVPPAFVARIVDRERLGPRGRRRPLLASTLQPNGWFDGVLQGTSSRPACAGKSLPYPSCLHNPRDLRL